MSKYISTNTSTYIGSKHIFQGNHGAELRKIIENKNKEPVQDICNQYRTSYHTICKRCRDSN